MEAFEPGEGGRLPLATVGDFSLADYMAGMRVPASLLAAALFASPALAQQSVLQGIGFAQAEEGTWLCRHEDPNEALACAREHCAEEAGGQECYATAWCFPAGWSGIMTLWLPDFHTTRVLCGFDNEAALKEVFAALCKSDKFATHCDLTRTVDPDGNEREVQDVTFPGGGAAADGSAPAGGGTDTGNTKEGG
jgi:hypothetical protein